MNRQKSRHSSSGQRPITVKLLLVGDSAVGKSALLLRFADDFFISGSHVATIGIDVKHKTVKMSDKRIKLQIWDTAGQERFSAVTQAYYRGADGLIIMYSIDDDKSFQRVSHWLRECRRLAPEDAVYMLLGNKCDLEDSRRVIPREAGQELAKTQGMHFMETSGKEDINVTPMFAAITRAIMRHKLNNPNFDPVPSFQLSRSSFGAAGETTDYDSEGEAGEGESSCCF